MAEAIRASQGGEADRLRQVAGRLLDLGKYAETERMTDIFCAASRTILFSSIPAPSAWRTAPAMTRRWRGAARAGAQAGFRRGVQQYRADIADDRRPDTAIGCFAAALRINAKHADVLSNMAAALSDLGLIEDSTVLPRGARDPTGSRPRALGLRDELLRAEQFAEGWELFEARDRQDKPKFNQPAPPRRVGSLAEIQSGERIFLYYENGLGDTLQMVRYAPGWQRPARKFRFPSNRR